MSRDAMSNVYSYISPYAGILNNPMVYVDNGGDSKLYYAQNGQLLFASGDNLRNMVVVVMDNERKKFDIELNAIKACGLGDYSPSNQRLRQYGTSYPVGDYLKLLQNHPKKVDKDGNYLELGVNLYEFKGVMEMGGTIFEGDAINTPKQPNSLNSAWLHTHPNTGEFVNGRLVSKGPSRQDLSGAPDVGTKFYDIAVEKDRLYLFQKNDFDEAITFIIGDFKKFVNQMKKSGEGKKKKNDNEPTSEHRNARNL